MAKNYNYYFLNGDQYESSAIYIPYRDSYIKNVKELSQFDLATLELGKDYMNAIQDANPTYKLGNQFYIAKDANTFRIFKPIEVFVDDNETSKKIDKMKEYAEERYYNYSKGISLELSNKDKLVSYVYSLYNSLTKEEQLQFMNSHLIGSQIKNYFLHNAYMFKRLIDYTQIRNMLITYLYIKANKSLPTSYQLGKMIEFSNNIQGLYPKDPNKIKEALEEYKNELVSNADDARKDYEDKLKEENVQITLFDLTGDESVKILSKRKN